MLPGASFEYDDLSDLDAFLLSSDPVAFVDHELWIVARGLGDFISVRLSLNPLDFVDHEFCTGGRCLAPLFSTAPGFVSANLLGMMDSYSDLSTVLMITVRVLFGLSCVRLSGRVLGCDSTCGGSNTGKGLTSAARASIAAGEYGTKTSPRSSF